MCIRDRVALGGLGIARVGWGLSIFILIGVFLVIAYNLELWHGRFHNDTTFALAWGSFPVLTDVYKRQEPSITSIVNRAPPSGTLYTAASPAPAPHATITLR